jgi:hypothetical protein
MLEIDPCALIGKGLHRECFVHPDNPDWCIKIVVAGNSNENHREAKYYGLLARRGISWEMLTRFHGLVETNLGEGAVFDLVRDYDGGVAKTLTHYLSSEELTTLNSKPLGNALTDLRLYLLQNRVVTMTLKTKNILFQKTAESDGKLVIVDNVGNSDFIPISNYNAWLARLKIERKWQRFEQSVRVQHAGNKALPLLQG